jgi:ABC-type multidrug transport system fused ATPase/permease subunit
LGKRLPRLALIGRRLGPFTRPHRRRLGTALVASVVVTAAQLALPSPLTWLVALTAPDGGDATVPGWLLVFGSPLTTATVALIAVGVVFGLAEYVQRVAVAKYVVRSVNDTRVGILGGAERSTSDPGDVVTRVVNDTARLRVGMKGVLVHLLQHGLFLAGVSVVLLSLDPWLGLTYLAGLGLALGVAALGTDHVAALARRRRGRESRVVDEALRAASTPDEHIVARAADRTRSVAVIARAKGRTAGVVQGVLAVTACLVLTLAVRFAEDGRLHAGDVALVSSYLLMLHYPMMRMGRQITRLGPQITSAERLARLVEPTRVGAEAR